MTQAKQEVIDDSVHPLHTYIASAVESGHFRKHLGREFTWDELQRQLKDDGYGSQSMNTKEVEGDRESRFLGAACVAYETPLGPHWSHSAARHQTLRHGGGLFFSRAPAHTREV